MKGEMMRLLLIRLQQPIQHWIFWASASKENTKLQCALKTKLQHLLITMSCESALETKYMPTHPRWLAWTEALMLTLSGEIYQKRLPLGSLRVLYSFLLCLYLPSFGVWFQYMEIMGALWSKPCAQVGWFVFCLQGWASVGTLLNLSTCAWLLLFPSQDGFSFTNGGWKAFQTRGSGHIISFKRWGAFKIHPWPRPTATSYPLPSLSFFYQPSSYPAHLENCFWITSAQFIKFSIYAEDEAVVFNTYFFKKSQTVLQSVLCLANPPLLFFIDNTSVLVKWALLLSSKNFCFYLATQLDLQNRASLTNVRERSQINKI